MRVFCPACGHANEVSAADGKVTCAACTNTFEAPRPPPPPPPPQRAPEAELPPRPRAPPPPPPPPPQGSWEASAVTSSRPGASGQYNSFAIASFVCGVLCCVPFAPIGGLLLGYKAIQDLQTVSAGQKGRELAIAGMILGALALSAQLFSFIARVIGDF